MNATLAPSGKVGRTVLNPASSLVENLTSQMDGSSRLDSAARAAIDDEQTPKVALARVLRYQNDAVVAKFQKELKLDEAAAKQLFEDTLRFMWLAGTFRGLVPTPAIDDGWHQFILFTMDYRKFCHKFFKRFVHHRPHRPGDKPDGTGLERTMKLVKKHLGTVGKELHENWNFQEAGAPCDGRCSFGKCDGCREYCKCGDG